jgi:hypothetical protein
MLLKEHRYMFLVGATRHVFRVEELVKGAAGWPRRFRLKLAASSLWEAQTFYGVSCRDVAEKAAKFLALEVYDVPESIEGNHESLGPPSTSPSSPGTQ